MKNKVLKVNLQHFAMKNKDLLLQQKTEIMNKINKAMKEGNEEEFQQAFTEFSEFLQEQVLAEARGLVDSVDSNALIARGVRQLTSEEKKYYQKVIDAMKSSNPKQALNDLDDVLPKTVIDSVFEDIVEAHPLLDVINFENTGALTETIVSTLSARQLAAWGKLCDDIVKELSAGFIIVQLGQKKLSAFLPICKAMLDLGPEWVDRYVRAHLTESIFNGLEQGIIDGNGLDQPTGMRRNPSGALDPNNGYPLLPIKVFSQLTPETYGQVIAELVTAPTGLNRVITEVLMIVNPADYFSKIMPATCFRKNDGTYMLDIFPFPTKLIQSAYVPANEAIVGIGKRYFMGVGAGKAGKIEYSDEYRFLEDERLYLTKLYGNGRPVDNKSFVRLNITNLKPTPWQVYVTNSELGVNIVDNEVLNVAGIYDARLASLKIGALTLSPAFNKSVMVYTAATTDATNTITAVAKDGEATIAIKVNNVAHTNGTAATWDAGVNTVEIIVTSGTETETYSVTVTKS